MGLFIKLLRKLLCCSEQDFDDSYSYPTTFDTPLTASHPLPPFTPSFTPTPPVQTRWSEAHYTLPTRLDLPDTVERYKYDTQGRGMYDDLRYNSDLNEKSRSSHLHLMDIKWDDDTLFRDNYNRYTGNFI